jgi:peptidoglycan-associated lipoprotein
LLTGAATASADTLGDTYFDFDSAQIRASTTAKLTAITAIVREIPAATLVLEAHADPRGTGAYNVGLTARRAQAVRDELVALGIPEERIVLVMYGEDGPKQSTYAKGRRVTISLTADPLYTIIDRRLGVATALVWSEPVTVAELEGPRVEQTARR